MVQTTGTALPFARVASDSTSIYEVARQEQAIALDIWSPNASTRDILGSAITSAVASSATLQLPDGSYTGIPRLSLTNLDDLPETNNIWRRTNRYIVEYATTRVSVDPAVLFVAGSINQLIKWGQIPPAS